jgi:hypothetical protein
MGTSPNTPRILKGALVSIDPPVPIPNVIVFQYNPDTLTRSIKPKASGGDGARSESQRLTWGMQRIVPVRVNDFSITEEAFDTALNPIRAKVSLGLRVLSYNDLSVTDPSYYIFLAHQVIKETMAARGSVSNPVAVAGGDVKLF